MNNMTEARQQVKYRTLCASLTDKQMQTVRTVSGRKVTALQLADEWGVEIMTAQSRLVRLMDDGYLERERVGTASKWGALYEYSVTADTLEALKGEA